MVDERKSDRTRPSLRQPFFTLIYLTSHLCPTQQEPKGLFILGKHCGCVKSVLLLMEQVLRGFLEHSVWLNVGRQGYYDGEEEWEQ